MREKRGLVFGDGVADVALKMDDVSERVSVVSVCALICGVSTVLVLSENELN